MIKKCCSNCAHFKQSFADLNTGTCLATIPKWALLFLLELQKRGMQQSLDEYKIKNPDEILSCESFQRNPNKYISD